LAVKSVFAQKYIAFAGLGLLLLLTLSGCGLTEPIDENTTGWFNHYFVYSFSRLIIFFADLFNGSFGLSIIAITILIRLALMPLMLKQFRNQRDMQAKMKKLQPELSAIQEKYKASKDQNKQQMQMEMMQLYQKHQVNPLGMIGCLPLIIQLPILMGFYYAIMRTPEIATHSFLWFDLGETDIILPIVAAAVYFLQYRLSMQGMPPEQQKQMQFIGMLSPILMGLFSFTAPAALPLYWTVGGCFLIFQSMLSKKLYPRHDEQNQATSS